METEPITKLKNVFGKISLENAEGVLTRKVRTLELSSVLVGVAIAIYTVVFSTFTIMKHYGFRSYAWDLGIFNQAFWTTVHDGRLFYSTPELLINSSGSFFGTHFSPILFLLLPFYAVIPAPETLLMIQSLVLALGAVPLYKLARLVAGYRTVGLAFVSIYLLYPALQGVNWFDFHVQSFLPLFFLSALYFLEKQQWKGYFLFIALSLITEEHAAIIVVFIGLLVAVQHRNHLISAVRARSLRDTVFLVAVVTVVSGVLWYITAAYVRGVLFPVNTAFLSIFKASSNWSVLGVTDPLMIPVQIILHPTMAISALNYDILLKISYLLILFGPLALAPLFRMRYLLPTVPWFFLSLFSNYQPYYILYNQYAAYVIAFIFAAAIYLFRDHGAHPLKTLRKRLGLIFFCGLVASILVSPLSPIVAALYPNSGVKALTQHEQLIYDVLSYVPPNASILTHNNLFPQVSNRINAYAFPTIGPIWSGKSSEGEKFTLETLKKVDYVLIDIESDSFTTNVFFSLLRQKSDFSVFVSGDGVLLFKKNYSGNATILEAYDIRYDYESLSLYSGEVTTISGAASNAVLHFNGTLGSSPLFWYGPRSLLPPGEYNVTLRLKVKGTGDLFTVSICSASGQNTLASKVFSGSEFKGGTVWLDKTFRIMLTKPLTDFEVRAINVSGKADIYLDYIDVTQVIP